jgi:hypothetical protein
MNIFKYFSLKIILSFLITIYFIINIIFIFEFDKILRGDGIEINESSDKKEQEYLMKIINFNNTFYKENDKIKFLYNSYNPLEIND